MTELEGGRPAAPRPAAPDDHAAGRLRRLLAEPLFHFCAVGVIVFGAYWLLQEEPEDAAYGEKIEISADDVRQIAVAWLAQGRPPLTEAQLRSVIDQKIADEILFREGLALGLDRNDEIIRRRVVQKMDFLAADIAALQEPDRAELLEWFSQNEDRFALPPRASFRQLYFSPDKLGASARDVAAAALDTIAGKPIASPEVEALTDSFVLRPYYSDAAPDRILKEFGPVFAAEVFKLAPGGWRGPVQSGYGWHLVWIESIAAGRVPAFEEVEADIRSAWIDARYQEIKRAALEEMRSRYTVNVVPLETIDLRDLRDPAQASGAAEPITQ
ncbi:peptidylprolyl isomerase [Pikeienuella sp. HZG-20]|uniref:peptidylprolyl isomerase n=1 Tax=Paludibacillus litoralis TaxID=3133267 RepID=UPI0030EF42C1